MDDREFQVKGQTDIVDSIVCVVLLNHGETYMLDHQGIISNCEIAGIASGISICEEVTEDE